MSQLYFGHPEERFISFASACLGLIRSGRLFRAGVNWGIAVNFAGKLTDRTKTGSEKFERAWVLLKALEACLEEQ